MTPGQISTVLHTLMSWSQGAQRVAAYRRKEPIGCIQIQLDDLVVSPEAIPRPSAASCSRLLGGPEDPRHPLHWMLGASVGRRKLKGGDGLSDVVQHLSPEVELSSAGLDHVAASTLGVSDSVLQSLWNEWVTSTALRSARSAAGEDLLREYAGTGKNPTRADQAPSEMTGHSRSASEVSDAEGVSAVGATSGWQPHVLDPTKVAQTSSAGSETAYRSACSPSVAGLSAVVLQTTRGRATLSMEDHFDAVRLVL